MCATICICKTCKYIKGEMLEKRVSSRNEQESTFSFRLIIETRYLKKKKKKRKERFCIFGIVSCVFFFNDTLYAFNSIISYRFVSLWIDCHVRTCTPNVCVNKSIKLVYNFLHGDIIKSKVYNMINWTSVYQETNLSSVLLVLLLVTTYLTSIDNF